ncbi:N,N-dimethylformamidase beta subunit family domain-containing protein, partial [Microvirga sp. 0TCS3.31]
MLKGSTTTKTATSDPVNFELTAPEPNAIVLENQKLGNPQSEWDITGAGSSNIEGFATDISINRGNRVDFKINTDSSNYRIDIYRLGYYGGLGARKVATLEHSGVQTQPTPLRDSTTGLVDAGNWSVSASWEIPADAVSGIYVAKLVRQDGTAGQNHIPFIVRDDSSASDIVFQTADTTWQAYNHWGGANLYQGNGPGGDTSPGRAYKVSYNRPIVTRGGGLAAGPQDYIFGVEFPALMWLEKNGYDVSYMSGVDVDRFGDLLKNHKMYLSVGHDEYWSGQQRANVEAARDAGVNLAFWSGNEAYWKTRWEPSISAGAQGHRTLVSYKETRAGPIDPSNEWTGTWRDPRFVGPASQGAGKPENSLTGTMFQVDSYRADAITVPYDDADLRFWRNTSVATLQPGQTATLTKNYLGYEWDAAPDNGFDPAGLVKLSSTTIPVDKYLRDYGTRTGSYPTATHNLTLYRAPSGALVFGAGTVYWAWGLDNNHDLQATPVDPRVKQAMVNLLADMGIQPGTLETGLVEATPSTDLTAPSSTITAPNGGSALTVGQAVTISGTASDSGGGVVAGVEITTDNGATWHPVTGDENWNYSWVPHTAGTFTIKTRAVDDSVNLETPGTGRTVTVTGNNLFPTSATPPNVAQLDPKAIELGMKFQSSVAGTVTGVRFFKNDLTIGTHTGTLWSSTGTKLASATFTNETGNGWQAVSFSNPVAITPNTTYVVSYYAPYGYYTSQTNGFASAVTNGPITAPTGAGVYVYSSTSAFPTSVYKNENYWVDVLFNPSTSTTNRNPVATSDSGL